MIEIELDIFSGRPNPRWKLTPAEQRSLLDQAIEGAVPMAPASVTDGRLGYRGFLVRATGDSATILRRRKLPTYFRVRNGLTARIGVTAEEWLLDTAQPRQLHPEVRQAAAETMTSVPQCTGGTQTFAECMHRVTSSTDFSFWNADDYHRLNNNCYNYAANWRTNTFAQPGRGTGQEAGFPPTVPGIRDAALRDGWRTNCDGDNLYVAFAIWPGQDFHWWRRTQNASDGSLRYCHKPGKLPVRGVDNSGNVITNPYSCNRGGYTDWGGFLHGPGDSRQTVK